MEQSNIIDTLETYHSRTCSGTGRARRCFVSTEENIDKKVEIAVEKKSSQTVATAVAAAKQVVVDMSTSLVLAVFNCTRQNPEKKKCSELSPC